MRILMAGDYPDDRSGGTSRIQHFTGHVLRDLGHDVDLVYRDDIGGPDHGGLRRLTTPKRLYRLIRERMAANGPYDVVNIHEPRAAHYCRRRRRDRSLPPCVVSCHTPESWLWDVEKRMAREGVIGLGIKSRILWPLTELTQADFALRNADHVLAACGSDQCEFMADRLGVDPARITRIENGVPDALLEITPKPQPGTILFMGTWIERKGCSVLARAFSRVAGEIPEARLRLIGTCDAAEADILAAFDPGCRDRVTIRPLFDDDELRAELAGNGIFVLPSWTEGLPLSMLEAMAGGLAVVSTDTCGMRDVVRHEENGLLVPVGDADATAAALGRLLRDDDLRKRLAEAARETARNLTWQKIGERYAELFERVAAAEQGKGAR